MYLQAGNVPLDVQVVRTQGRVVLFDRQPIYTCTHPTRSHQRSVRNKRCSRSGQSRMLKEYMIYILMTTNLFAVIHGCTRHLVGSNVTHVQSTCRPLEGSGHAERLINSPQECFATNYKIANMEHNRPLSPNPGRQQGHKGKLYASR